MKGTRTRHPRGFSLAELVVWLALLSLVATMVLSTLVLAVRLWSKSMDRVRVQQNVRLTMDTISAEMREGIADADTGTAGQTATGYLSISPPVTQTAILLPNANTNSASSTLTFTIPSATLFDPTLTGWTATNPANFQRIRYYMSGAALRREQITWSSSGSAASTVDDVLASPSAGGSLQLTALYLSPTSVTVTVAGQEGSASCTLKQTLQVIVQ